MAFKYHRYQGSLLLELSIALFIISLTVIWAGQSLMRDVDDALAKATGQWMLAIKGGMDQWLSAHFNEYAHHAVNTLPVTDPWKPRLSELKTLGHLPPSFPEISPMGTGVLIEVYRDAPLCPGVGCRIESVIYSDHVIKRASSSYADLDLVARVIQELGAWGGASWMQDPHVLRGANFTIPNPYAPDVGIVAAYAMLDTTLFNQFVRIGDDRDPSLQGQLSVRGAASVSRLALHEAVSPMSACETTTFVGQGANQHALELATTPTGSLVACIDGQWRVLSHMAKDQTSCGDITSPEGAISNDTNGVGLICRDGQWSPLAQYISRFVVMASQRVPTSLINAVSQTQIVKPNCGVSGGRQGQAHIYNIPQSIQPRGGLSLNATTHGNNLAVSGTLTLNALNFYATDQGQSWLLVVPPNSQSLAISYCVYE